MLLGLFQPRFDHIPVRLGRFDALARFLLETVLHIHAAAESYRIHRAIGAAIVILYNFQHSGGPETLERLGLLMLIAALRQIESIADDIYNLRRHFQKILLR